MHIVEQLPLASASEVQHSNSRLTEISLRSDSALSRQLLAGMLLELSNNSDQRWLCWVAPRPLKPLLGEMDSEKQGRILQVVTRSEREIVRTAGRALASGRSHTVALLVSETLSEDGKDDLAAAAQAGEAECLLIYLNS